MYVCIYIYIYIYIYICIHTSSAITYNCGQLRTIVDNVMRLFFDCPKLRHTSARRCYMLLQQPVLHCNFESWKEAFKILMDISVIMLCILKLQSYPVRTFLLVHIIQQLTLIHAVATLIPVQLPAADRQLPGQIRRCCSNCQI